VDEIIRVERQTVRFFDGLEVDGYRLPSGEFRVGLTGASLVLGYKENWLRRVLGRGGTALNALRGLGFTEQLAEVVHETVRGAREVRTIGLRDFNRLMAYAVADGKKAALALQLALTLGGAQRFFCRCLWGTASDDRGKTPAVLRNLCRYHQPGGLAEDGSGGHPAAGAAWRRTPFALGPVECFTRGVVVTQVLIGKELICFN